jgi:hypothetical protein
MCPLKAVIDTVSLPTKESGEYPSVDPNDPWLYWDDADGCSVVRVFIEMIQTKCEFSLKMTAARHCTCSESL